MKYINIFREEGKIKMMNKENQERGYEETKEVLSGVLLGGMKRIVEVCGEGVKGIERAIEHYRGVGGVYALENKEKKKVYIGSSMNLSRRMGQYRGMRIENKRLLEDVKAGSWGGFQIVIISVLNSKKEQLELEYSLIKKGMESEGVNIYNIFKDEEEKNIYGELIKRRGGKGGRIIWLYGKSNILGPLPEKTKDRMRKVAKDQKRGERLKEYQFKEGLRIRVIDIISGQTEVVLLSKVPGLTGGSKEGVKYALKNNTQYRGRYVLEKVGDEIANRGGFEAMGNGKGIILEDTLTGEVVVGKLGDIVGLTGGSKTGVYNAIKGGRVYKKRYRIRYVEEGD